MAYSDKVIDYYTNPRNVGTLDKSSHKVGTGLVRAPECSDVTRLQIHGDAMKIDNMDIVEELALPPVKIHCSVLAEDAIKAAINDFRVKNGLAPIESEKVHH